MGPIPCHFLKHFRVTFSVTSTKLLHLCSPQTICVSVFPLAQLCCPLILGRPELISSLRKATNIPMVSQVILWGLKRRTYSIYYSTGLFQEPKLLLLGRCRFDRVHYFDHPVQVKSVCPQFRNVFLFQNVHIRKLSWRV